MRGPDVQKLAVPATPGGRRFGLLALLATMVALAGALAANVAVNPRGEFPTQAFQPLVADDPAAIVERFEAHAKPVRLLVLGSSRAEMLPPGPAGFNFAVPGGGLRDDRLAYEFVRARQGPPAEVVLGLDSFQLTARDLADAAILRSSAAATLSGREVGVGEWASRALASLDTGYLQDTARALRYATLGGFPAPAHAIDASGVMHFLRLEEQRANGSFDLEARLAQTWTENVRPRYPDDAVADPRAVDEVRSLVGRMLGDGVKVHVVLLPFHPATLEQLRATGSFARLQSAALEAALSFCPRVQVHDHTEPVSFGGDPSAFYDGLHLAPENARLLMASVLAGRADACA